ncbi:MAG: HAMP domain-containing sensor histidine kinase [Nocardioides sp.]|uniref:sensor histidine kinase n=1 Tax=Nocardioides sp. TaxID=35761 RepID=UPI0039E46EEB
MRRPLGLRSQLVAWTALLAAGVMIALVLGTQAVLELTAHRDVDRALGVRADAALGVLKQSDEAAKADLEPGSEVYDDEGDPVAGALERELRHDADELATATLADGHTRTSESVHNWHLRAVTYTTRSGERGVVVVSEDASPYERSERYALVATVVLGALVVALTATITHLVTRRALGPVRQMAERATEWSEHDLSHRFELGPPTTELAALGETLDGLLDRVAAAIHTEQRLTAELAHELRTPLTAVRASADLALLRPDGDPAVRADLVEIREAALRMSEVITSLLEIARHPERGRGEASTDPADVLDAVEPLIPARLTLSSRVAPACPQIAAPADLVVRALAPLVDNACRHAAGRVRLGIGPTGDGRIAVTVEDDGDGVPDALRATVFGPGTSGADGTGLGLGIARRVARSLGGDVVLAADSGSRFVLTLPAARPAAERE